MTINNTILNVQAIKKYFPVRRGFFQQVIGWIKAVDGVDFEIKRGKTLGLVGESGQWLLYGVRVVHSAAVRQLALEHHPALVGTQRVVEDAARPGVAEGGVLDLQHGFDVRRGHRAEADSITHHTYS